MSTSNSAIGMRAALEETWQVVRYTRYVSDRDAIVLSAGTFDQCALLLSQLTGNRKKMNKLTKAALEAQ